MANAVTFIAHGSRVAAANGFLAELILGLGKHVNIGFLELAEPSIAQALQRHIVAGARRIRLLPLFLSPGRHVGQDVPAIVRSLKKRHPQVEIVLEPILAEQPGFAALLQEWLGQ